MSDGRACTGWTAGVQVHRVPSASSSRVRNIVPCRPATSPSEGVRKLVAKSGARPADPSARIASGIGALDLIEKIEERETFGAGSVRDLSWKQLLDGYTCTECGRCSDQCPALATGKPLDPQKIVLDIRDQLLREGGKLVGVEPREF